MKIYLVEDVLNAPGRIYACFAEQEAAEDFLEHYHPEEAVIVERTLLCGQHITLTGYIK